MNTSFAGVQDNNQPAPPSASAPDDELLYNSPNLDINSLSNPMSIPDIAPIASDQTDNQPPSWDNIDEFFYHPPSLFDLEPERIEDPAPKTNEAFHEALANRKWLSQQRSMPRYNCEGMKARQNAEAARVNAEMERISTKDILNLSNKSGNWLSTSSDLAQNILTSTKIGSNLGYLIYDIKPLYKTVNAIPIIGFAAMGVEFTTDVGLSSIGEKSWIETGVNSTTTIVAIRIAAKYGGWYGMAFDFGINSGISYMKLLQKHPEYAPYQGFKR